MRAGQTDSGNLAELSLRKIEGFWSHVALFCTLALAPAVLGGCAGLVSGTNTTGNTPPPPPSLAITNVQAVPATTSTAQIVWTTNVPADSAVDYGTGTSYGASTPIDSTVVTNHQVTISGLAAGTTYYYQVNSNTTNGSHGHSGGHGFKTSGFGISGTISPATGGNGAMVNLSGSSSATTMADSSGNYAFAGLPNGTYAVAPSHAGFAFAPSSQSTTVNGNNVTGVNFTDTTQAFSISGTISPTTGGSGATVTLSGATGATTIANSSGAYTFIGLASGSYTLTPSNTGFTFTPLSQNVTVSTVNVTGVNFTESAVAAAPTITAQPGNQTVTAGQTATFTVVAAGTAPLSYQWQKSGVNIAGATAASYTTPATTTGDSGATFRVVVSNSAGTNTSSAATLTVNASAVAPTITTQPANQTVTAGQTASFTVVAAGTAPLSYQWQKSGVSIAGATSASYTTPAATTTDNGATFRVTVSNTAGTVTSAAGTLTVNAVPVAPTITTQPANQTVTAGQTASFTVVATGTAPLSYQWQKNGGNIAGAIAASYTTPATTTSDSGATFQVAVSNTAGTVTSAARTLTVNAVPMAPTITTQPASQTVTAGQTASFTVVATGTAPLSYQWQKSGVSITGATSASYTTPATTTSDSGATFRVVVSNTAGTVTSAAGTLTVNTAPVAPTITTQPANQTVTAGQTATFIVVAAGTAPLSYQWQKSGGNIAGAIAASYTTPATTPSDSGATFQVVVSNTAGTVTSAAGTLTVNAAPVPLTITTSSLPSGQMNNSYSASLAASGGTAPYTWSLSSGSLPVGLSLAATTGVISGTPTIAGNSSFTMQASDAASNTVAKPLAVSIATAGTKPQTDQYFGLTNVICPNTNTAFSIVKVGNSKVFCTPQGHAMFSRGFYVMDQNLEVQPDETGKSYFQFVNVKYGSSQVWFTQELNRMISWGFNAVGPFSNTNLFPTQGQATKVPFVLFETASSYSLVNKLGWGTGPAKEIYRLLSPQWGGFVGNTGIPDYRDPNWAAMVAGVLVNDFSAQNVAAANPADKGYLLGVSYDDSDGLHGFGAGPDFPTQPAGDNDFRLGYMAFFLAPTDYANSSQGQIYPDATVYLKRRFHDMLVAKYGTVAALNNTWGSGYSTLDSSGTCVGSQPITCASSLPTENVGTGNGSTKSFSTTLAHTSVSTFSLGIFVGGTLMGGDSGNGTVYGPGLSGTVNYGTGALSLTFNSAPPANAAITANYIQNGWGIGSGLMDEDCRGTHSSYCGDGSGNTTIYLTGIPANAQTDINALTQDTAAYYSSTINAKVQSWASAHGFTGHVPYLGPTTLGTWSAPPDRYVLQGFAGNVDAWQYGGVGTFSQAELDFVNTHMGDVALIEGEYRTANADSPYAWPNSACTHSGSSVTCVIAAPNHFAAFAGNFHIDSTCNNADYSIMNVNYTATSTTVTYTASGTPSEASAICKVFFDDANVGGFPTQAARGQDFFNKVSILPSRSYTATGTHPFVGYFWWQYTDNEAEKLNWGLVTLRDNAYDGNEDVGPIVVCSPPLLSFSCGSELRGPFGSVISAVSSTNTTIDNILLTLP